jgi:DNA-binding YbaB/EbfC family protein
VTNEGPDLNALMAQLGQMQQSLQAAQESAADEVIEGTAGGGAVKITTTGDLEFQSVHIDPSVVDPDDLGLLEDLVLAALRDALDQIQQLHQQALGGLGGLSGLGGLFGAP